MRSLLLCLLVLSGHALASPLAAQECPAGRVPGGDLGIRGLLCTGPAASCAINVRAEIGEGVRHVFAVEPVITELAADSGLRVGDALVAIDSLLITTAAGGERLARLNVNTPVRLLVRRGGVLREVRMTAGRGCGIASLRVTR